MNRESIGCNMTMEQANEILMLAKQGVHSAQYATYKSTKIKSIAASVKNEVMEMIPNIRERKGRLDLPENSVFKKDCPMYNKGSGRR